MHNRCYRRSALCVVLLALVLGLGLPIFTTASRAGGDSIPLEEYWRRLDTLAEVLGKADPDHAVLTEAVDAVTVASVILPDGQVMPVSNDYLTVILRRDDLSPKDLEAARARLAALRQLWGGLSEQPNLSGEQTFVRLDEILSQPRFSQAASATQKESLLARVFNWLGRELSRILRGVGGVPGIDFLLTVLGVAALLAVLIYVFRGAFGEWVAEGRRQRRRVGADEADLSSDKAWRRAQIVAEEGDYRQAVRYLYLSTLLWLDERRLLRYDPALTNREFLRQVSQKVDRPRLHKLLAPVVELFDQVWYGFTPLDRRGYTAYARQVERVRQWDVGDAWDAGVEETAGGMG